MMLCLRNSDDEPALPGIVQLSWQLTTDGGVDSNYWTVAFDDPEDLPPEDREELSAELSEIAFGIQEGAKPERLIELSEAEFFKGVALILNWLPS